jgi:hypothetical protein
MTMRPPPAARIAGHAACASHRGVFAARHSIRSSASSSIASSIWYSTQPALWIRKSMRPCTCSSSCTSAWQPARWSMGPLRPAPAGPAPAALRAAQDALRISASAIGAGTDVMHHHLRTTLGQQAAVGQAQSTGGTGHQAHLAFKGNTGNGCIRTASAKCARPANTVDHTHDTPALSPKRGRRGLSRFRHSWADYDLIPSVPFF